MEDILENKLLKYFNVKNHSELSYYIKENPDDKKVQELLELFKAYDINIFEEE